MDLAFGIESNQTHQSVSQYTRSLRDRLRQAYQQATAAARIASDKQKKGYDMKSRGAVVHPGDRVLVKTLAFDGRHKLADRYEEDAYIVLKQPNPDIPVFEVQKENGEGRKRTLHRNHLLPIGSLPMPEDIIIEVKKPMARKRKHMPVASVREKTVDQPSEDETDEFEMLEIQAQPVHYPAVTDTSNSVGRVTADSISEDATQAIQDEYPDSLVVVGEASGGDDHMSEHSEELYDTEVERVVHEDGLRQKESGSSIYSSDNSDTKDVPVPRPRRSTRQTQKPAWFTSGEYVVNRAVLDQDPCKRSKVIQHLASQGVFEHVGNAVSQVLLSLVDGHR